MKKLTVILSFACFAFMGAVQAQVPNSGFENWTAGDPDDWATSNVFAAGLVNITQSTDCFSGSYAVKGDVVNFFGTPMGCVIQSGEDGTGFPVTEKYLSVELYYKFTSVGGDKFSANFSLVKEGNPIAQGAAALPANVGTYTHLVVPFEYFSDDVPDQAILQISITGPVTGNDVHIGSVMYVDDVELSFLTGVEEKIEFDLTAKCYPNPASDMLTVSLGKPVNEPATVIISDIFGREVKKMTFNATQVDDGMQIPVNDLFAGLYFYSVRSGGKGVSGKFTVNR